MRPHWKYVPLCLLFVTSFRLFFAAPIHAQEPDFSDTPDILHGTTNLLRDDDVVVAAGVQTAGPPLNYYVSSNYLLTQDSSFSSFPTYNQSWNLQAPLPDPTSYAAACGLVRLTGPTMSPQPSQLPPALRRSKRLSWRSPSTIA